MIFHRHLHTVRLDKSVSREVRCFISYQRANLAELEAWLPYPRRPGNGSAIVESIYVVLE